jgi:lipopolysaccharide biosynthesis protein
MAQVMREKELKVKSRKVEKKNSEIRAALHLHLHYTEGVEELLQSIKESTSQPDLFISTTSEEGKVKVKVMLGKCGLQAQGITIFPNRGRDIGPFLTGYGARLFKDYEIVGHLHSKKSPHAHDDYLENWVEFLEKGLIGEKGGMMDGILEKMASDPSIGIIYPDDPGCFGWEGNYSYGKALIDRLGYKAPRPDASMNFPVGTMFWARTAALKPLLDLNLQWEDYPEEPLPIDGSMLHAMERLFGIVPSLKGYRTVVTRVEGVCR